MNRRPLIRQALVAAGLAACAVLPAHAQLVMGRQATVIQTVTTSAYLNGGIGADEQATMRGLAKEFPLRVMFSAGKDGEFLADIPLVVQDSSGHSILALPRAGPMLYVMLPQGRYRITALFNGVTRTQEVSLSERDGRDLLFHWGRGDEAAPDGMDGLIQSSLDPAIP